MDGDLVSAGVQPDANINGGTTSVSSVAYTNSHGGALATTLYTLDATTDSLFIQNPPNGGVQTVALPITLNGTALDFTDPAALEIPAEVKVSTEQFTCFLGNGVLSAYREFNHNHLLD